MTLKKPYSMIQIKPKIKSYVTQDIKALHDQTLNNLKSSKANNTIRAYKSDFRDFEGFLSKSWV